MAFGSASTIESMRSEASRYAMQYSHDGAIEVREFVRYPLGAAPALQGEPVAWREHVEQRLRSWRQRTMNKSGDHLALDDFMGQESIDDLIDFVCDEWSDPLAAPQPAQQQGDVREAVLIEGLDAVAERALLLHEQLRMPLVQSISLALSEAGFTTQTEDEALQSAADKLTTAANRCALAGLGQKLRRDGLAIFDGPECSQVVRDAIEWCAATVDAALTHPPAPPAVKDSLTTALAEKLHRLAFCWEHMRWCKETSDAIEAVIGAAGLAGKGGV